MSELGPVRLEIVSRAQSALWNEYLDRYHYLGYAPLAGAQLRYWAYAGQRLVALFSYGAADPQAGAPGGWHRGTAGSDGTMARDGPACAMW